MQRCSKSICLGAGAALSLALFADCAKETAPVPLAPAPREEGPVPHAAHHRHYGGGAEKPTQRHKAVERGNVAAAPKVPTEEILNVLRGKPTPTPVPSPTPINLDLSAPTAAFPPTLPTFFPPKATATVELPIIPVSQGLTLAEFSARISKAMDDAGYERRSYFWLDKEHAPGFAIITHIEQIHPNGVPVSKARWSFDLPSYENFSIATFLRWLIKADPGNYRLIAIVVSKTPFKEKKEPITEDQVGKLTAGPKFLAKTKDSDAVVTGDYHCIAYIYEFERKTRNDNPVFKDTSDVSWSAHLASTPLWKALTRIR